MPGEEVTSERTVQVAVNQKMPIDPKVFGAVVFFYHADGVNWRTRADGTLDEIPAGQGYPRSWG